MSTTASQTIHRTDVLVIGAGQAGLAAGYHLRRLGIDHRIVEADARVGDVWRRRYESLTLYSPARLDALPGMPFPLQKNDYPTGSQMADYLESYAARWELPIDTGVTIRQLDARAGAGEPFLATADGRQYETDQVIVATGTFQRPRVPTFASDLDPGIGQLHSSEYRNPSQLADGPVLIVGLSHSGSDLAHEIAGTHAVIVAGRAHGQLPFSINSRRAQVGWPVVAAVQRHLLTLDTPIGRKVAPKVRSGGAPLVRWRTSDLLARGVELVEARMTGVQNGRPVLADGRVLDVANVVWCTGFEADYSWISPPLELDDGIPVQHRGVSPVPGLYFLGLLFQYSFASMLVHGAGRDARYVVDRIARVRSTRGSVVEPNRAATDYAR